MKNRLDIDPAFAQGERKEPISEVHFNQELKNMEERADRESPKFCPFCGDINPQFWGSKFLKFNGETDHSVMFLRCLSCGAMGPKAEGKSEALFLWNKRTDLDSGENNP